MAISGIGATSAAAVAGGDRSAMMTNYEAFLQLLTTQLRNQSPLEPLDANQFTQQLVQFSSVEQAIKTNASLERMIDLSLASQATALVSFIGSNVVAEGSTATLADGKAEWRYTAAAKGSATATIRNSEGAVMFTGPLEVSAGAATYRWDGKKTDGSAAPAGTYSITIAATASNGSVVDVTTEIAGQVTGIDFSSAEPALLIGDVRVPVSAVRGVSRGS